jgi:Sec-independent protein translocase protein TatA
MVFVAFLFLLVWVAGYLPRLGDAMGDFLYGYRSASGKPASPSPKSAQVDRPSQDADSSPR